MRNMFHTNWYWDWIPFLYAIYYCYIMLWDISQGFTRSVFKAARLIPGENRNLKIKSFNPSLLTILILDDYLEIKSLSYKKNYLFYISKSKRNKHNSVFLHLLNSSSDFPVVTVLEAKVLSVSAQCKSNVHVMQIFFMLALALYRQMTLLLMWLKKKATF